MVQLLGFATSYFAAREAMYVRAYGELVERGAVFAAFAPMMRAGDYAYLCYAAVPLWLLCRNVAYLYSGGSRAIYTMRRLPKRSELIVRCAALPALCLPAAAGRSLRADAVLRPGLRVGYAGQMRGRGRLGAGL